MQEAAIALLARWQNFYGIVGAAAATLTGLMFVATTLYAGTRLSLATARAALEAFSTPTVVHFGVVLLVAAILSAPWQALWPGGLLLAAIGLGGIALVIMAIRWERRQTEYRSKLADWLWYRLSPLVAYAALVAAAILLPGNPAAALAAMAAVVLLLLLIGIRNAWDSVTYLAIEHSQPEKKSQD